MPRLSWQTSGIWQSNSLRSAANASSSATWRALILTARAKRGFR
jgi:hypothetical protein